MRIGGSSFLTRSTLLVPFRLRPIGRRVRPASRSRPRHSAQCPVDLVERVVGRVVNVEIAGAVLAEADAAACGGDDRPDVGARPCRRCRDDAERGERGCRASARLLGPCRGCCGPATPGRRRSRFRHGICGSPAWALDRRGRRTRQFLGPPTSTRMVRSGAPASWARKAAAVTIATTRAVVDRPGGEIPSRDGRRPGRAATVAARQFGDDVAGGLPVLRDRVRCMISGWPLFGRRATSSASGTETAPAGIGSSRSAKVGAGMRVAVMVGAVERMTTPIAPLRGDAGP